MMANALPVGTAVYRTDSFLTFLSAKQISVVTIFVLKACKLKSSAALISDKLISFNF